MSNTNLNSIIENLTNIVEGNEPGAGQFTQTQLVAKYILELIIYLSERYHID